MLLLAFILPFFFEIKISRGCNQGVTRAFIGQAINNLDGVNY